MRTRVSLRLLEWEQPSESVLFFIFERRRNLMLREILLGVDILLAKLTSIVMGKKSGGRVEELGVGTVCRVGDRQTVCVCVCEKGGCNLCAEN